MDTNKRECARCKTIKSWLYSQHIVVQLSPISTEALVSGFDLAPNISSFHTSPNPALTQPTPFDKSNFICPMRSSPNLKRTCSLLLSRTSCSSIPYSTHFPFALKKSGIPSHVVCATNSGYTKPRAHIPATGVLHITNHVHTLDQSTVTSFHKRKP